MAEAIDWFEVMRTSQEAMVSEDTIAVEVLFGGGVPTTLITTMTALMAEKLVDAEVLFQRDGQENSINDSTLSRGLGRLGPPRYDGSSVVVPAASLRLMEDSLAPGTSLYRELGQARHSALKFFREPARARAIRILSSGMAKWEMGVATNDPTLVEPSRTTVWEEKLRQPYPGRQPTRSVYGGSDLVNRRITDNPDLLCLLEDAAFLRPPGTQESPVRQRAQWLMPKWLLDALIDAVGPPLRDDDMFRRVASVALLPSSLSKAA